MIPDSEIPKCPEFEVKSKIGKLFMNEKIFEEYSVRICEIDPYFYEHHKQKIKVDKNGQNHDEQNHEGRDLVFEKKRQEALEKKLGCKFIRINTSDAKRSYDTDYQLSKIQIFTSEFKDKKDKKRQKIKELEDEIKENENTIKENENKIKEKDKKIKELQEEIKKLKLQLTNQSV